MLIRHGEFYLGEGDREALEALAVDEAYVRRRCDAVKLLLQPNPVGTARQVAERFGVSRRTVQRWMARYRARGLGGLREDSRRPRRIRRKVTPEDEAALLAIRRRTDFGPDRIKALLDAARRHDPGSRTYSKRTIHKVLQRHGIVEAQRKALRAWRTFEWGRPRDLVQLDLTDLGPVPIVTAVDDHSRCLWAAPMEAETDDEVFAWNEGPRPAVPEPAHGQRLPVRPGEREGAGVLLRCGDAAHLGHEGAPPDAREGEPGPAGPEARPGRGGVGGPGGHCATQGIAGLE